MAAQHYGTRRLTAPTDGVAVARWNVAPEMFRAMTRKVLFDHTAASSSMNRADDAIDAWARAPARAPFTVTSTFAVAPGPRFGRPQLVSSASVSPARAYARAYLGRLLAHPIG